MHLWAKSNVLSKSMLQCCCVRGSHGTVNEDFKSSGLKCCRNLDYIDHEDTSSNFP